MRLDLSSRKEVQILGCELLVEALLIQQCLIASDVQRPLLSSLGHLRCKMGEKCRTVPKEGASQCALRPGCHATACEEDDWGEVLRVSKGNPPPYFDREVVLPATAPRSMAPLTILYLCGID